jgi:hypothetical protein
MTTTVRGFSCKIPFISVRFPKNWHVFTNSGENPQQMFKKFSHESAGLFDADIRMEGQLLSTPGYSMRTSGWTDVTYPSLCRKLLSKATKNVPSRNHIIHF